MINQHSQELQNSVKYVCVFLWMFDLLNIKLWLTSFEIKKSNKYKMHLSILQLTFLIKSWYVVVDSLLCLVDYHPWRYSCNFSGLIFANTLLNNLFAYVFEVFGYIYAFKTFAAESNKYIVFNWRHFEFVFGKKKHDKFMCYYFLSFCRGNTLQPDLNAMIWSHTRITTTKNILKHSFQVFTQKRKVISSFMYLTLSSMKL